MLSAGSVDAPTMRRGTDRSGRITLAVQTTVAMSLWAFFKGQLPWLVERRFDVHAIASAGEEMGWVRQWNGVQTHSVNMTRSISPLRDLASLASLIRLYRRIRATILHSFTPKAGLLGMLGARLARCPVRVYTIWGLPEFSRTNARWNFMRAADRFSCEIADRVYVECESIRKLVVAQRICPPQKLRVLPAWSLNSITSGFLCLDDVAEVRMQARRALGLPDHAVVLGYVGRIVRDKGIEELVQAFLSLAGERPEVHLLLVGAPEGLNPVNSQTKDSIGNHPRIHSVGFQTNVRPFLCAMDFMVHPSYREGLPSSPLEGAAVQLPVITTRVPGCVDAVVDRKTGFLVEPRDVRGLLQCMRVYSTDKETRMEHGINGRKRVLEEFDPVFAWERLRADYLALVESGRRSLAPHTLSRL